VIALAVLLFQGVPVEVPAPPGLDRPAKYRLVRVSDAKEIPFQATEGRFIFLAEDKGEYRWETGVPGLFPKVELKDVDGKHLVFSTGGKDVVRYNYGHVPPPAGVDPVFGRSGYLHPVFTPDGRVISNDVPKNHLHHHGIWFPWTSSEFEGRPSDFWNSGSKQGKVECVKVEGTESGPVFAGFTATHRFVNLNAPDGPKTALNETWQVRVFNLADRFVFDLVSTQTCATDKPLVIKKYRYGGLGFRGSIDWEGKEGVAFLTSEGKTRANGHETTARWCVMTGKVGGKDASIGFLCHPSNFRAPQNMRIHPDEPFFNWAPSQAGDFSIEPGKPYVSRYRFIVASGPLPAESMEREWKAYADPPAVTVGLRK
jgi:hypothetical protein